MGRVKIEVDGFECERCNHKWIPRKGDKLKEEPIVCPGCNSPYWNKPRKKIKKVNIIL